MKDLRVIAFLIISYASSRLLSATENLDPNWFYLSSKFKTTSQEWIDKTADIAINKNEEPSIGVCYTQYTQYKSLLKLERPDTNPQRLEVEIKLLSNVDLETADPPIVRNISPVLSMRGQLELRPIYDNLHALLVVL